MNDIICFLLNPNTFNSNKFNSMNANLSIKFAEKKVSCLQCNHPNIFYFI
jgi:hypothetical protein